ncbi:hypothetical protein BASA61_009256 [Batrachochytrium salamandrivorans]|nr:hypothetical protein BASA61_009256 [Batrachochytrium salamandrivorans]
MQFIWDTNSRRQDDLIVMIQDHLRQNPSYCLQNGTIPPQLLLNYDVSQSNPLTVDSLTQLSRDQLRSFSDICGIPYDFTKAEYAVNIKNKLLDSVSPLVGEDGMVSLQFTPKPPKQETSDIANRHVHIDRLEALSLSQLLALCRLLGFSNVKFKVQLLEELHLYLKSNPSAIAQDGKLIPGNESSISRGLIKRALSKPMYIHSLDASRRDDIRVICKSYGISKKISEEQLLKRFRLSLRQHPEVVRADGTIDLVALAHLKK